MKKSYFIWISIVLLVVLFVSYVVIYIRPPIPDEWNDITLGMKRERLLQLHPNTYTTMRDEKGYDLLKKKNTWPYFRNGSWGIRIYYNDSNEISELNYNYYDDGCGWLNKIVSKKSVVTQRVLEN